jgi:G patch domain-containing protein 1
MDEEDLADLREGQKLVDTNDEMDLLGGTQAELGRKGGVDEPEKEYVG